MIFSPPKPRVIVITLDAFGTLFYPRQPIGVQYANFARECGLGNLNTDEVEKSFRKAFKVFNAERPNYGKAVGMHPESWWKGVMHNTFIPMLPENSAIPQELIDRLYENFSSEKGYALFPDVLPFFQELRRIRNRPADRDGTAARTTVMVGALSNSDDRIKLVLKSLGIRVGPHGPGEGRKYDPQNDIDFIKTSYEVDAEKPDAKIFAAAMEEAKALHGGDESKAQDWQCLHIGDDYAKDYCGAKNLPNWDALLLRRDSTVSEQDNEHQGLTRVSTLSDVPMILPMIFD